MVVKIDLFSFLARSFSTINMFWHMSPNLGFKRSISAANIFEPFGRTHLINYRIAIRRDHSHEQLWMENYTVDIPCYVGPKNVSSQYFCSALFYVRMHRAPRLEPKSLQYMKQFKWTFVLFFKRISMMKFSHFYLHVLLLYSNKLCCSLLIESFSLVENAAKCKHSNIYYILELYSYLHTDSGPIKHTKNNMQ